MRVKPLDPLNPPRGHDTEMRAIAGLIHLGNPKNLRVQEAMLKLDKNCFTGVDHRVLFNLIKELFDKGQSFDFVSFIDFVPSDQYMAVDKAIHEDYLFPNALEHDVERLLAWRTYRNQLSVLINTINRSLDCTLPEESVSCIIESLQELSNCSQASKGSLGRSYEQIIDEYLSEGFVDNTSFPVNIPGLPNVPNRSLITIAGRSGHGKTFFALYLMDAIIEARPERQTLYFNLEMQERVMVERHARLLGFNADNPKQAISDGAAQLLSKRVSIVSVPAITIEQIEAECRLAALKQPIGCIVVDYIGLVTSRERHESKHLQQQDVAKRLAALSLNLDCTVMALIQVNRDFKTRTVGNRCPQVSDASESMGTVHSSTWWIGIDQPQNDDESSEYQDLFQVVCRKNRVGGLFNLDLKFKYGKFWKYDKPFAPKRELQDNPYNTD